MYPFKFRMLEELRELETKIANLQSFCKTNHGILLDEDEEGHSTISIEEARKNTEEYMAATAAQLESMRQYRACLIARLRYLGIDINPREPYMQF